MCGPKLQAVIIPVYLEIYPIEVNKWVLKELSAFLNLGVLAVI